MVKRFSLILFALMASMQVSICQEPRVLVISGGGARGAWGAGLITALIKQDQADYRAFFTTSTGSLMAPLLAIKDTAKLKHAYTEVTQKKIFNKNPFRKDGTVRGFSAFLKILFGKRNLGETKNLRNLIGEMFTATDFEKLKASGRPVNVSVVSLTNNTLRFKSTDSCTYDDMVDWIWASANQPLFMTTVNKDGEKWVDGGVKENVPITEAVLYARQHNISTVDVVVNNLEGAKPGRWPGPGQKENIVQKLLRTIDIFSDEVRNSDIVSGVLRADIDSIVVNVYYMSPDDYALSPQSLLFKPEILRQLWDRGIAYFDRVSLRRSDETKIGNLTIRYH